MSEFKKQIQEEAEKEIDEIFAIRVNEKVGDKIYRNVDYGDFFKEIIKHKPKKI